MASKVSLLDGAHAIIEQRYSGDCTVRDYYQTYNDTYHLSEQFGDPQVVIVNLTACTTVPIGTLANAVYEHAKRASAQMMILVGANRFLREIIDIVDAITPDAPRNVFYARHLSEAHDIIAEQQYIPLSTLYAAG